MTVAARWTAIPDKLVDELVLHGSLEHCRERVAEYHATGLDTPGHLDPADSRPEHRRGRAQARACLTRDVRSEFLLAPLRLRDTYLGLPASCRERGVTVHGRGGAEWLTGQVISRRAVRQAVIPAASVSATARDLARLYQALAKRCGGRHSPLGQRSSPRAFGHNGSYVCLGWADPDRQRAVGSVAVLWHLLPGPEPLLRVWIHVPHGDHVRAPADRDVERQAPGAADHDQPVAPPANQSARKIRSRK